MTNVTDTSLSSLRNQLPGIVGGLVGFAAAQYLGFSLFIPMSVSLVVLLLLRKRETPSLAIKMAMAVLVGHGAWILVGSLMLGALWNLLDVAILLGGAVWLALRPGPPAIVTICLYEAYGVATNLHVLVTAAVGSPGWKALIAHLVCRSIAACFLLLALRSTPGAASGAPSSKA